MDAAHKEEVWITAGWNRCSHSQRYSPGWPCYGYLLSLTSYRAKKENRLHIKQFIDSTEILADRLINQLIDWKISSVLVKYVIQCTIITRYILIYTGGHSLTSGWFCQVWLWFSSTRGKMKEPKPIGEFLISLLCLS